MKKFKAIPPKVKERVTYEVKLMLAAHRDYLWNCWTECSHAQAVDPNAWQLVANDGYYGEAFGVMRGLICAGYGYFGPDNLDAVDDGRSDVPEHNLKWWFNEILNDYLHEEGFFEKTCTADRCKELLDKYRILTRK